MPWYLTRLPRGRGTSAAPAEDGGLTANARIVRAGKVRDGRVAVLGGVKAGEKVVSVGQNKLHRGVRVVIDESVTL